MDLDMKNNKSKYGVVCIDGRYFRLRSNGKPGVELPYCNHTMTDAEFRAWVLGGLRDKSMKWPPAAQAWKLKTRSNQSGSRHKLEHLCNHCNKWFVKKKIKIGKKSRSTVELDHIIPIGGLSSLDKLKDWVMKAFVDTEGYQKLCYVCHTIKTKEEKK